MHARRAAGIGATRRRLACAAVAITACGAALGCAGPRREAPAVNPQTLDDMQFLHDYLIQQPTVTVDEAYRAMLILADGQDASNSFERRRDTLTQRGIVRPAWNLQPDYCIDKGSIAYMTCAILDIRGGVNRIVLGSWGPGDRRYALRELSYRQLMASAPTYQYITGAELVSLLRTADEYLQSHGRYTAGPMDLGPPPKPGEPLPPQT